MPHYTAIYIKKALRVGQIYGNIVLQFWAKLGTDHPFGLTWESFEKLNDVNFAYFM